jgi:hypothetical protein
MKSSNHIEPKNLTAQLHYRGIGNPPTSHPSSAISNSFPGLEADFRNIWIHFFEGIILHEASNLVVGIEDPADSKLQRLMDAPYFLVRAHGKPMTAPVKGPTDNPRIPINDTMPLEWSNALAEIIPMAGKKVSCVFENTGGRRKPIRLKLTVRHFFDHGGNNKVASHQKPVISEALAEPGELTQSLCSPWQNDYRECGCFYWAASRPDYVNVEAGKNGKSAGNNWMEKNRNTDGEKSYISDDDDQGADPRRLIDYQDLFTDWENHLRFIIGGKDEMAVPPKKKRKKR